ncbi:MAG: BtrH N-terminal domain-containing protein [Anaerolineae bacterium]|nr:BtrH N-terminal domain-containing protein [Anaerolineae bacterium]
MIAAPVQIGGSHTSTAALKNVLAASGVTAPHTNQPFTEAMLLGIGGGLGAGYILWEFKAHGSANIVMGFSNRWNYAAQHLTTLCERLNVKPTVQESGGIKAAAANFQKAVDAGRPFITWVDKASMPYQQLPEALKGYGVWIVAVHGIENGEVLVNDLGQQLYHVPLDVFNAARNVIPSDKNRILTIELPAQIDLPAAIQAGIQDCIEYMSSGSESFAPPVYKKWSKLMTDTKNKKGWPVVFAERKGLYDTLCSIYEGVRLDSTEGYGLRSLYADFLDEAAPVIDRPMLKEVAEQYRKLAALWIELTDVAVPESEPVFKKSRALLDRRYALLHQNKQDELRAVSDELAAMRAEFNRDFPLTYTSSLFESMQVTLNTIYEAEIAALNALKNAL